MKVLLRPPALAVTAAALLAAGAGGLPPAFAQPAEAASPLASPLASPAGPAASAPAGLFVHRLAPGRQVRLDGRLGDPAWAEAPVATGFSQHLPTPGAADPRWRTEVRLLVEDDALVLGVRALDPEPERIRAPLLRRDRVTRDQDFISLLLDTGGERRAAQFFRINPRGVVADGSFIPGRTAQVEGNDTDEDFSPDFDVEVRTSQDERGYVVEMRVPFSTLRLPRVPALAAAPRWTAMVTRSIPREASVLLTSVPIARDALSFIAAMPALQNQGDLAERAGASAFLALRPALTVRTGREREGALRSRSREAALGLDLKWRPRADWVFDATLNPDFSQVEQDVPQLAGNTRFALSVPEKRPFFLESTDVLDLPISAFYSRSVTDPRVGARATWRSTSADATALALRDDGGGLVLQPGAFSTGAVPQLGASEVALVRGRWHAEGDAGRFVLGGLATRRDYAGSGGFNQVMGVDALWRPDDAQLLRARVLASDSQGRFDALTGAPVGGAAAAERERGQLFALSWLHRTETYSVDAKWQRTGTGFRNDNGFVEQSGVDVTTVEWIVRHGELAAAGLRAHEFETFVWTEHRQALADAAASLEAQTISRRLHPGVWWTADSNIEAWVHAVLDAERVRPGGRLHPVRGVASQFGINPAPWFTRLMLEAQWGERVDVEADRVGPGAVWLVDARWRVALPLGPAAAPWGLELQQRLQQGTVDAPQGGRSLTDRAWQLFTVLHLSEQHAVRLVLQGQRTERVADAGSTDSPPPGLSRGRVASLVAQRRLGVGRSLAAGYTREDRDLRAGSSSVAVPGSLREELFLKWSFEL